MWLFSFIWLGCQSTPLDTGSWQLELSNPTITEMVVECESNQWSINVRTENWTGNGLLWLSDGERYERHSLYSISASPDGSSDRLRSQLTVIADWRDVQSSRTTGFDCSDIDDLGIFAIVRHPQSYAVSSCAEYIDNEQFYTTPTLSLWDTVPLPDCPDVQ